MSVAQKDGIRAAEGISYDDLYRRWEQANWQATAIDFSEDRDGWEGLTEIQRRSALWIYSMFFYGEDSVTDNLSPYIDAAPKAGAEVLPRHPAGRRGPPRGLLPPLLQGGDRRRRLDLLDPRLHRVGAQLGLPQRLRPPRPDGRRPAPRPLAAELRPRDRAVPHGRRGDARPAGAALHRGLLRRRRDDARLQRGDGERLPRRAAPHRLRRQGALGAASRSRRSASRRSPSCCASCCPTRSRCSRRSNGPASTPAPTASSSRTSSPSGCARCGPSGGRPATRSRTCPGVLPVDPELDARGGRAAPDHPDARPA